MKGTHLVWLVFVTTATVAVAVIHHSRNDAQHRTTRSLENKINTESLISGDCDFSVDWCGWTSNGTWLWSLDRYTERDHTMNTTGGGAVAVSKPPAEGKIFARLISPTFPATGNKSRCLTFWYLFDGTSNFTKALSVKIITLTPSGIRTQVAWHLEITQSATSWQPGRIPVVSEGDHYIMFVAQKSGASNSTETVIDDIIFTDGPCSVLPKNAENGNTNATRPSPPAKPVEELITAKTPYDCTFDSNSLCSWNVSPNAYLQWQLQKGPSSNKGSGPRMDHTTDSVSGYYIIMKPNENLQPYVTEIKSARISSGMKCLSFYYYMWGKDVNVLSLYVTHQSAKDKFILWRRDGNQGPIWHKGQVNIVDSTDLIFTFEAHSSLGKDCEIALDDIIFQTEPCHTEGFLCDFEDGSMCTYNASQGPGVFENTGGKALFEDTTPSVDHTLNSGYGHYLALRSGSLFPSTQATLTSTNMPNSEFVCLRFWYFISVSNRSSLTVTRTKDNQDFLFRMDSQEEDMHHRNGWQAAEVTYATDSGQDSFVFNGSIRNGDYNDVVALDDLQITEGFCGYEGDCNFDNYDLCTWNYDNDEESFQWQLMSQQIDHTTGNGSYLSARLNNEMRLNSTADIYSQVFVISEEQQQRCLHFWYKVNGPNIGTLRVLQEFYAGGETELWSQTGNNKPMLAWTYAKTPFESGRFSFHLVFQATMGSGKEGEIALDDIMISDANCAVEPEDAHIAQTLPPVLSTPVPVAKFLDCDFSNKDPCSWYQQNNSYLNWSIGNMREAESKSVFIPISREEPESYLFLELNYAQPEMNQAIIYSPKMEVAAEPYYCFSFWSYVFGSDAGNLTLKSAQYFSDKLDPEVTVLWKRVGAQIDAWEKNYVTLNWTVKIQMEFQADIGYDGVLALDNFEVELGQCPVNRICGFEGHSCKWANDPNGTLQWLRSHGNASSGYFPAVDHTTLTDNGRYMKISNANRTGNYSRYGIFQSVEYSTGLGTQCLKFWYYLNDAGSGKLSVHTGRFSDSPLWERGEDIGKRWRRAQVPITTYSPFQIYMNASFPDASVNKHISIDDLTLDPVACEPAATCTFDSGYCGYTNDVMGGNFTWMVGFGRTQHPEHIEGPKYDSAGQPGLYLYADFISQYTSGLAAIRSDPIVPSSSKQFCVEFSHFFLNKGYKMFRVLMEELNVTHGVTKILWPLKVDATIADEGYWKSMSLPAESTSEFELIFLADKQNFRSSGFIGIDNVVVSNSICAEPVKPPDNTTEPEDEDLGCDFEKNDFCGWKVDGNNMKWYIGNRESGVKNMPTHDHTLNNDRGRFMYVNTFGSSMKPILISRKLKTVQQRCVTFWYMMSGERAGSLSIRQQEGNKLLWTRKGSQGDLWRYAQIKPTHLPTAVIQIEAYFDDRDYGFIAVDDIHTLAGECPPQALCTFDEEDMCGMSILATGMAWTITPIPLDTSILPLDHTTNTRQGKYLYTNTTGASAGGNSELSLKVENPNGREACLRFWLYAGGVINQLVVSTVENMEIITKERLLYGLAPGKWSSFAMTIDRSARPWQVQLNAINRENRDLYLALDDVELLLGQSCGAIGDCDFEQDTCLWQNNPNNTALWRRKMADEHSVELPKIDHTTRVHSGSYLFVSYSMANDVAAFVSSVLTTSSKYQCFSFWYYVTGDKNNVATIDIFVDTLDDDSKNIMHFVANNTQKKWKLERADLPPFDIFNKNNYEVRIVVTFEDIYGVSIAVDDFQFDKVACKELIPENIDCGDESKIKLKQSQICDFVHDCPNSFDEQNCGNCDFENSMCNYTTPSNTITRWTRHTAADAAAQTSGLAPSKDNTKSNSEGHYMIPITPVGQPMTRYIQVKLHSPAIQRSSSTCHLAFWYFTQTSYQTDVGLEVFEVNLIWQEGTIRTKIFNKKLESTSNGHWTKAEVYLGQITESFAIEFAYEEGYDVHGEALALDDVSFTACGYPDPSVNCPDFKFNCSNSVCIYKSQICDFSQDCGDGSDEESCDNYLPCNFEKDMCYWTASVTYGLRDWKQEVGRDIRDHTYGTYEGRYAVTDNSWNNYLTSGVMQASNNCTMRYYFILKGNGRGNLTVKTRKFTNGPEKVYKSYDRVEDNAYFMRDQITFQEDKNFQIFFQAVAEDHNVIIGLDDISFDPECIFLEGDLNKTEVVNVICPGQFQCHDDTCVDKTKVCNFYNDCKDNSDEIDCGSCDFENNTCSWKDNSPGMFRWNRLKAANFMKHPTLPQEDHSVLSSDGSYMVIEKTTFSHTAFPSALLESPFFQSTASSCEVNFWYHFNVNGGNLNVKLKSFGSNDAKLIATLGGSESREWHPFHFTLGLLKGQYKVIFEAKINEQNAESPETFFDFAIDDIKFSNCSLWDEINQTSMKNIKCAFDETKLCHSWYQDIMNNDINWKFGNGSTQTVGTGPQKDHGAGTGSYLYLESFSKETVGRTAYLLSSLLPPASKMCFTFFYHMFGEHVNSLGVSLVLLNGTVKPIWLKLRSQSNSWIPGEVNVESDQRFQIRFEGRAGDGIFGDVAIDDVALLQEECKSLRDFCDFELSENGLCNWENVNQNSIWERIAGNDEFHDINVPDHTTGTKSGHFLAAHLSKTLPAKISTTSYVKASNNGSCVSFWYSFVIPKEAEMDDFLMRVTLELQHDTGSISYLTPGKNTWEYYQMTVMNNMNFKLQIEAQIKRGTYNDYLIAIDDVEIVNSSCVYGGRCSFETGLCGWQNAKDDDSTLDWLRSSGNTPSDYTGPSKDHTSGQFGGDNGLYLFVDASKGNHGNQAVLESPELLNFSPVACFRFYYHMRGKDIGKLSVSMVADNTTLIYATTGNKGDVWLPANIEIHNTTKTYRIQIAVQLGDGNQGDIAIDDLALDIGECSNYVVEPSVNLDTAASCRFQNGSICNWTQSVKDEFNWTVGALDVWNDSSVYVPPSSTSHDSYLYVESNSHLNPGSSALISTPSINHTSGENYCFTFDYYLFGSKVGNLSLYMELSSRYVLWRKVGAQIDAWQTVSLNIDQPGNFKLFFEARIGMDGVIAMDEFTVSNSPCETSRICTFEQDTCDWHSDDSQPIKWIVSRSRTGGYPIPESDHSSGDVKGNFMLLQIGNDTSVTGTEGHLLSVRYPKNFGAQCLQFWYYMSNSGFQLQDAMLEIFIVSDTLKAKSEPLWQRIGERWLRWHRAQVTVGMYDQFQIVFKGNFSNNMIPAAIAIDDVQLIPSPCGFEGSCSFDSDFCGYTNDISMDDFDWLLGFGRTENSRITSGPATDSSENGLYAYVDLTSVFTRPGGRAVLRSDEISVLKTGDASSFCLRFFYVIYGQDTATLTVYHNSTTNGNLVRLQQISTLNPTMTWAKIAISFTADSDFEILFEALKGDDGRNSFIGIDTISVSTGNACEEPQVNHTTDPQNKNNVCSFEKGDDCYWGKDTTTSGSWLYSQDQVSLDDNAPLFDHTTGSYLGRYLYVTTRKKSNSIITARFQSPSTRPGASCVSFWYYMYGERSGSLNVLQQIRTDGTKMLWSKSHQEMQKWRYFQMELIPISYTTAILEAVIDTADDDGFIAIDDISLIHDVCPPESLCTFDEGYPCGYIQASFNKFDWNISPSEVESFPYDHTTNTKEGKFYYTNTTAQTKGNIAAVFSPVYPPVDSACLKFWHYTESPTSFFSVSLLEGPRRSDLRPFVRNVNSKSWDNSYVTIEPTSSWQVEFKVTSSSDQQQVYVGLDDIEMIMGDSCKEAVACDFEQNMCSWQNMIKNDVDWIRKAGYETRNHTLQGPLTDHSTATTNGYYIYVINANKKDETAKIQSSVMHDNFKCFSYWYLASTDNVASLSLHLCTSHAVKPMEPLSMTCNNTWQLHRWDITSPTSENDINFQVELIALFGDANGILALDDFRFYSEACKDLTDGEVHCLNGKGSVKRSEWCNFAPTCEDKSDEMYCGNCDFEDNACQYVDVSRGNVWYEWAMAEEAFNKTGGAAPAVDYSNNTPKGHYVVTLPLKPFLDKVKGEKAIVQSPLLQQASATCQMTFWAFLPYSAATMRQDLQISLVLPNINSTIPISEIRKRSGVWETHEVFIGRMTQPFMVEFQANWYETRDSFAIDQINFEGCGFPSGQGRCNISKQLLCRSGACYDKNQKCDFTDDCGDESDEISCNNFIRDDFEKSFGYWENEENAAGYKRVKSASNHDKIPTRDHTKNTNEGHFLLAYAENNRLMGPVLQASGNCTMRFYHIIKGTKYATLSVKARDYNDGPEHTYLRRTRSLGPYFVRGEVTFQEGKHFQVIIEANIHDVSEDTIALDDISFSSECLISTDPLIKNPEEQTCSLTEFQCKTDDHECVPLERLCDFNLDCTDGSDENVCGQCDFTSGQCGWNDVSAGIFKWQRRFIPQPRTQIACLNKKQGGWVMDVQRSSTSHTNFPSAFLESNVLQQTATTCQMTFDYQVNGDSGILKVNLRDDNRNIESTFLHLVSPPDCPFESVSENLGSIPSGYQLVFEADVVGRLADDLGIYIANVSFTNCSRKSELQSLVKWDLDCDFDKDLDKFNWYQERADDEIDWMTGYGATPTKGTGPEKDHTTGDGQYLYITATKEENQNKVASLKSFLIPENEGQCLTFYYHMFGEHVNTLQVHVVTKDDYDTLVWQKKYSEGNVWRPAEVNIFSKDPHQIVFTGTTGIGKKGDIAIDDIKILKGHCSVNDINFCDFEINECGFTSPKEKLPWRLQTAYDHTTNSDNGQVLMSQEPQLKRNSSTYSQEYSSSIHGSCAQLWVDISGKKNVNLLASILAEGVLKETKIVSLLEESEWEFIALNVEPNTKFQVDKDGKATAHRKLPVLLTAYVAPGSEDDDEFGKLFVDDFLVNSGSCASEGTCNFENGLCAWTNINSQFQWLRSSGSSLSDYLGPETDHTNPANNLGFYLYLDSVEKDSVAKIRSSSLDVGPHACFSLYYSMFGEVLGTLSIELTFDKVNFALLHSVKNNQDGVWKPLILELRNITTPYWLQIKGQVIGGNKNGNIAIDDLLLTNGTCDISDFQVSNETVFPSTTTTHQPETTITTGNDTHLTPPPLHQTEAKANYGWVAAVVLVPLIALAVGGFIYYKKRRSRAEDRVPFSIDNPLFEEDIPDGNQPFGYQEADTAVLAFKETNETEIDGGIVNPLHNDNKDIVLPTAGSTDT